MPSGLSGARRCFLRQSQASVPHRFNFHGHHRGGLVLGSSWHSTGAELGSRCFAADRFESVSSLPSSVSGLEVGVAGAVVSDKRLKEFLEAEVTHFAAMPRKALTLEHLLRTAASPHLAALAVHREIPKHFAKRIRQIEELQGWDTDQDLSDLHRRYARSFQEMRMTEVEDDAGEGDASETSEKLAAFTETVRDLKKRQRKALPLIGEALKRMKEQKRAKKQEPDRDFWNAWLNAFLRSRISTEMLTSQYLAVMAQVEKGEKVQGIVDPVCDPTSICEQAAAAACQLTESHMGIKPRVHIEVRSKVSTSFSYIPIYLHYILLEVLKNSCHATAKASLRSSLRDPMQANESKPISVVICSDDHRVAMRVSDLAGGIPFDVGDRVWDFAYSGSHQDNGGVATALSGYGLGLPLARLYARYLGGSLSLVSLPDYGCDTYLFLPRIDPKKFEFRSKQALSGGFDRYNSWDLPTHREVYEEGDGSTETPY
eukprot:gnl/TRDRNA2_/TRDRNA2_181438_c0_seq1.p1 gnl/TRDRNA2_/TRDRNA2_181438_c0~~gnl/TRDRNA2_/TRDRNA2_181438_c0_seq1.p1  ORF type:complete len:485 (+),score=83.20 gnl/TRDRNA2_/TRDRNA2_181438_c0_seq1:66-1520(+)